MLICFIFLRLLGRSAEDYPYLLGGNWISLLLPILVYAIKEGNALRRGWDSMRVQFWKDTKILGLIYAALFVWAVVHTTYRDHMDLSGALVSSHSKLQANLVELHTCTSNFNSAGGTIRDKQSLVDTQKTMISMQGPEAQQQANIASCIANLAKMNPVIREKITIIPFIGSLDVTGHFPVSENSNGAQRGLIKSLHFGDFVVTNEPERNFHGTLRCDQPSIDAPRRLTNHDV